MRLGVKERWRRRGRKDKKSYCDWVLVRASSNSLGQRRPLIFCASPIFKADYSFSIAQYKDIRKSVPVYNFNALKPDFLARFLRPSFFRRFLLCRIRRRSRALWRAALRERA